MGRAHHCSRIKLEVRITDTGLFDRAYGRSIPGLHGNHRRLRHVQLRHRLAAQGTRTVDSHELLEKADRRASRANARHLVLQID